MKYVSTKKYGHEEGLSCCFRQWRAKSHCNKLHGYPLAFEFTFESTSLDEHNWVVDFGNLKWLKEWLKQNFDHTTLLAADDPEYDTYMMLSAKGLINLKVVNGVGCEKVAEMVFHFAADEIETRFKHVTLRSVQVWEHGGNSARYEL